MLGVVMGIASFIFIKVFYLIEDGFEKLILFSILNPIGGILTGLVGIFSCGIWCFEGPDLKA